MNKFLTLLLIKVASSKPKYEINISNNKLFQIINLIRYKYKLVDPVYF